MARQSTLLMLALAFTCTLGWGFKAQCDPPRGWHDARQYVTGCYSDAVPFWGLRGVAAGDLPYLEARLEYPVLTGGLIWLEGKATRALFGAHADAGDFLTVAALGNALLAALVLVLFIRGGLEPWRLWGWALAPPLVLYLGHNWDMLAVALAVAAMLLAQRGKPAGAAAVAALGAAAKLFPVLLLPLLGLGALFAPGKPWPVRLRDAALVALAAIAGWTAVNLPVAVAAFDNWREFYSFSSQRGGTAATIWEILGAFGAPTDIATRNLLAGASFLAGAVAIVAAGWRQHRADLWLLFAPLLAWFLLTSKVWSPQFDLWLYPVLLMTLRRPWPALLFAAADIAAYFAEFWWFAGMEGASPATGMAHVAAAWAVRGAAMLWAIGCLVREPAPDWVRR